MPSIRNILLVLPYYYRAIHEGVARFAREQGWYLNNTFVYGNLPRKATWKGDGVITQVTMSEQINEAFRRLISPDVPILLIGRHILTDNPAIGRLAADHLVEKGFRNLAWMAPSSIAGNQRLKAFEQRLIEKHGRSCLHMALTPTLLDWEQRLETLQAWLSKAPKPLGVFAVQDILAIQVIEAALAAGLRVPDDVAVLGADNDDLICDAAIVPLSSIDCHLERLGYEAAAVMDRHLNGEPLPDHPILIPPKGVVVRQSTDIVAVEHPEVAKALRFIRENFRKDIGIADVVNATALSQRGLYKAFRKHLDSSIGSHILRERLACAQKYLLETNKKITAVALDSGFPGTATFYHAFKREFGMSPRQWRKRHQNVRSDS